MSLWKQRPSNLVSSMSLKGIFFLCSAASYFYWLIALTFWALHPALHVFEYMSVFFSDKVFIHEHSGSEHSGSEHSRRSLRMDCLDYPSLESGLRLYQGPDSPQELKYNRWGFADHTDRRLWLSFKQIKSCWTRKQEPHSSHLKRARKETSTAIGWYHTSWITCNLLQGLHNHWQNC